MANPILSGAIDTLRNRQVQGDPFKAFQQTRMDIGREELDRNRAKGMVGGEEAFKQRELGILAGYDPEKAMEMSGLYDKAKGQTSTKWDRQRALQQSPEVQALLVKYDEVLKRAQMKRQTDPKAIISDETRELSALEQKYFSLTNMKMPTRLTRQTLKLLAQNRQYLEKDDDDAIIAHRKIIDQFVPEVNNSIRMARVASDALGGALDLIKAKWNPETRTYDGDASASDIQSAIKQFVRSLDGSVVMQGEVKNIVQSDWTDMLLKYPNILTQRTEFSKDQVDMIFRTMVKSAKYKDKLLKKVIDGTVAEGIAMVDAQENWTMTGEQANRTRKAIRAVGSSRQGKYQLLKDKPKEGEELVGIFTDIRDDISSDDPPPSNTGKPVRADYPSLAEYATALKKWKANGE